MTRHRHTCGHVHDCEAPHRTSVTEAAWQIIAPGTDSFDRACLRPHYHQAAERVAAALAEARTAAWAAGYLAGRSDEANLQAADQGWIGVDTRLTRNPYRETP